MNGRTAAPTDESGALDFEDRKEAPAPQRLPTIVHATYMGVPVDIPVLAGRKQVEALIKDLLANGWTAPPVSRGGFGGRPDNRVEAGHDAAGNEICPIHKVKIRAYKTKDGREFKGCPSKATGAQGETVNNNGFCDLRFK